MPTVRDPSNNNKKVDKIPEVCPYCQSSISVIHVISKYVNTDHQTFMHVIYSCPNQKCQELILATYQYTAGTYDFVLVKIEPQKKVIREFIKEINDLSERFVKIYNEAYNAEVLQLLEICGPGYRKALEFLVKDYLITKNPENQDDIKQLMLSACIKKYIKDDNIKFCSERAAWVGNDETHYVRKWDNKDLQDLKQLIELTVNWISNEILTERFRGEMP